MYLGYIKTLGVFILAAFVGTLLIGVIGSLGLLVTSEAVQRGLEAMGTLN